MWHPRGDKREAEVRSILDVVQPSRYQWELNRMRGQVYYCVAVDPDREPPLLSAEDYEDDNIHLTPEARTRWDEAMGYLPATVVISLASKRYYLADRDLAAEFGQAELDWLMSHPELLLDRVGSPIAVAGGPNR